MWESMVNPSTHCRIRLLVTNLNPHGSGCRVLLLDPWALFRDPALFAPPSGPTCFQGTDQQQVTHPVAGSGDDPESLIPFGDPETMIFVQKGEGYWIFFFWNTFSCTPTFDYRAVVEFFWGGFLGISLNLPDPKSDIKMIISQFPLPTFTIKINQM